ncbi:unnamed protein product [Prorocentrum cordatum]|uniref:Uncharacterized protein n=1 Tax=Prorocentrum cordatum TaxID=2364126 RepID=A0ABN9Y097_9DINO|nr:unnamed protein product [Polarella glacialis]
MGAASTPELGPWLVGFSVGVLLDVAARSALRRRCGRSRCAALAGAPAPAGGPPLLGARGPRLAKALLAGALLASAAAAARCGPALRGGVAARRPGRREGPEAGAGPEAACVLHSLEEETDEVVVVASSDGTMSSRSHRQMSVSSRHDGR